MSSQHYKMSLKNGQVMIDGELITTNIYINDGTYGSLFDAGVPNLVMPTRVVKNGRTTSKKITSIN